MIVVADNEDVIYVYINQYKTQRSMRWKIIKYEKMQAGSNYRLALHAAKYVQYLDQYDDNWWHHDEAILQKHPQGTSINEYLKLIRLVSDPTITIPDVTGNQFKSLIKLLLKKEELAKNEHIPLLYKLVHSTDRKSDTSPADRKSDISNVDCKSDTSIPSTRVTQAINIRRNSTANNIGNGLPETLYPFILQFLLQWQLLTNVYLVSRSWLQYVQSPLTWIHHGTPHNFQAARIMKYLVPRASFGRLSLQCDHPNDVNDYAVDIIRSSMNSLTCVQIQMVVEPAILNLLSTCPKLVKFVCPFHQTSLNENILLHHPILPHLKSLQLYDRIFATQKITYVPYLPYIHLFPQLEELTVYTAGKHDVLYQSILSQTSLARIKSLSLIYNDGDLFDIESWLLVCNPKTLTQLTLMHSWEKDRNSFQRPTSVSRLSTTHFPNVTHLTLSYRVFKTWFRFLDKPGLFPNVQHFTEYNDSMSQFKHLLNQLNSSELFTEYWKKLSSVTTIVHQRLWNVDQISDLLAIKKRNHKEEKQEYSDDEHEVVIESDTSQHRIKPTSSTLTEKNFNQIQEKKKSKSRVGKNILYDMRQRQHHQDQKQHPQKQQNHQLNIKFMVFAIVL